MTTSNSAPKDFGKSLHHSIHRENASASSASAHLIKLHTFAHLAAQTPRDSHIFPSYIYIYSYIVACSQDIQETTGKAIEGKP